VTGEIESLIALAQKFQQLGDIRRDPPRLSRSGNRHLDK
jgi:hypothetical protein